jgi:hypothetical protein
MKDGNLTVLDAKETRKVMQPALFLPDDSFSSS